MSKLFTKKEIELIITSLVFIVILLVLMKTPETTNANAEGMQEGYKSENVLVDGAVQNTITFPTGQRNVYQYGNTVVPMFTTIQMTDWILRKGNELISIFQDLAFPFCVITFIIATGMTLLGCLSGKAGQGLFGMSASAIGYAAILYAPMLVNVVVCFISN